MTTPDISTLSLMSFPWEKINLLTDQSMMLVVGDLITAINVFLAAENEYQSKP